jgi:hypothetical protein
MHCVLRHGARHTPTAGGRRSYVTVFRVFLTFLLHPQAVHTFEDLFSSDGRVPARVDRSVAVRRRTQSFKK